MALRVPITTEHGLVLNESYHKIIHIGISMPADSNKPKIPDSLGNEMGSQNVIRFRVSIWINEAARRMVPPAMPIGEPKEYIVSFANGIPIEKQCYDFLKKQRGYEECVNV